MEIIETKHPSGNLNEKFEIVKNEKGNIIKDGKYEKWYENGNKECEGEYMDNKKYGYWKYWNKDGELAEEGEYIDDKKSDNWKTYKIKNKSREESNTTAIKTDLLKNNLLGKVKIVESSDYEIKEIYGEYEKVKSVNKEYEFYSEEGNILEGEIDSGESVFTTLNKYNDAGELIQYEEILINRNMMTQKIYHNYINNYDDTGNIIEVKEYDENGKIANVELIKYTNNENGNETQSFYYWLGNEYTGATIKRYDKNGNNIEISSYHKEGSLSSKILKKFDEFGNCIEFTQYLGDGAIKRKRAYKYDKNKNMIESNSWDKEDDLQKVTKYRYEKYDNLGNWISMVSLENNIPIRLTERKIIYYDLEKDNDMNIDRLNIENNKLQHVNDTKIKSNIFEDKVLYSLNYFKSTKKPIKILQKYHGLSEKEAKEWVGLVLKKHNLKYN